MFVQDNDRNMYVRNKTIHGTPIFVYTKATLTSIYCQTNDTHPRANTAKRSRTQNKNGPKNSSVSLKSNNRYFSATRFECESEHMLARLMSRVNFCSARYLCVYSRGPSPWLTVTNVFVNRGIQMCKFISVCKVRCLNNRILIVHG